MPHGARGLAIWIMIAVGLVILFYVGRHWHV